MSVRYTVVRLLAILGLLLSGLYLFHVNSYDENEIGKSTPAGAGKQDSSKSTCHKTGLLIFCSMVSVYSNTEVYCFDVHLKDRRPSSSPLSHGYLVVYKC